MNFFRKKSVLSLSITFLFVFFLFVVPLSFSQNGGITENTAAAVAGAGPTGGAAQANAASAVAARDSGCDWLCTLGMTLGNMILSVGALIAFLGGTLLDLAITSFILEMSKWLTDGGIGLVIDRAWGVVRDIVNLAFIFGFVYIGIRTIIEGGSGYRKFLAQLIIAALLINFSLFFTKVVIDVANVFALEVNQLMDRSQLGSTAFGVDGGIAAAFASAMGISQIYANVDAASLAELTTGGSITFFIMGAIFLMITGFVFAAAAVMIIIRFVALIFIMIGSPLYFASMVFPKTSKFTYNILGQLLNYAFYAPVFLFLIYISLLVVQTTTFGGGPDQLVQVMKSETKQLDQFAVFLQFAISIILIIASLRVAKSFSMFGANAVVGFAENSAKKFIGATTFGAAAGAARGTIGRASLAISEKEGLKEAASRKGVGGFMARRALNITRAGADASFDARQTKSVGKLGLGEGSKTGFKTERENLEKARTKFADSLGEVKDDDETMRTYQREIDKGETRIQDLKDEIAIAAPDDKKRLQGELKFAEFELKNYQEAIKYERNRRQIGSAEANGVLLTDAERSGLKDNFRWVATARDENARNIQRRGLQATLTRVKEAQKQRAKDTPMRERGYAGALEASPILNFFRDGHIIPAGKAIRKKYEKKFKRSKEDERTDRMVDSFKSSSK